MREQEFDALVSALREQAKALDHLARSVGALAAVVAQMVDDEAEQPSTTYLNGRAV